MQLLQGKVAIITGASFGLGKAIALKLAPEGAKLALVARTETELQKLKKETTQLGATCQYYLCDIRDAIAVEITVAKILKDFGTIDILINNAGVYYEEPTATMTVERIDAQFATNTLGTVYMTKYVLPTLTRRNSGQILNVVSIAGVETNGEWGIYAATKHAVTGFTESLRKELTKTKIKVMAIYPEGMNTNIFHTAGYHQYSPHEPWMMNPDDVADIVVFMLKRPDDISMGHVDIRKIES
ncbi:MAG: SDR family oxidoreductase [Patescibacteria group bacterium]